MHCGRAVTAGEIADAGALTLFEVETLSQMVNWNDVPLRTMFRFLTGCRTDFCNPRDMHRIRCFLAYNKTASRPWRHLRRTDLWLTYYEPLLIRYSRNIYERIPHARSHADVAAHPAGPAAR